MACRLHIDAASFVKAAVTLNRAARIELSDEQLCQSVSAEGRRVLAPQHDNRVYPAVQCAFPSDRSLWLNVSERCLLDMIHDRVRNETFRSGSELVQANMKYVGHHNPNPNSFVWPRKAEDFLAKFACAKSVFDKGQPSSITSRCRREQAH